MLTQDVGRYAEISVSGRAQGQVEAEALDVEQDGHPADEAVVARCPGC